MAQRLIVEIIGDSSKLDRTFRQTSRNAAKFEGTITKTGRTINRMFAAAGAGVGLGVVVKGLSDAVNAASDLQEQMSKTDAVFKQSARDVTAWSRTTATAMGISQRQALATASSFGALFAPLGIVGREAADQSKRLTQLGADLASFYNTDVQDALDAIRSGLVGEAEPLRRYGAQLSEARVQAEALAETGKKTAASLTQQEKVTARLALIFRDTEIAQGNFSDTSQGLANQMRILNAQIDNLQATLGEALLPTVTKIVQRMNRWLENTENQRKLQSGLNDTVEAAIGLYEGLARAIDLVAEAQRRRSSIKDDLGPLGFLLAGPREAFNLWKKNMEDMARLLGFTVKSGGGPTPPGLAGPVGTRTQAGAPAGVRGPVTAAGAAAVTAAPRGATAAQRNQWFDAMIGRLLGRVDDATTIRGQIAKLREIAGLIQKRIAATKDVTRRLNLEDQLLDVQRDIRNREQQQRDEARQGRERARQKLEDRANAVADALDLPELGVPGGPLTVGQVNAAMAKRQRAGFERRLGWLEFAAERAEATKPISDDLKRARQIEQLIKDQIAVEGRTLDLTRKLWQQRQKIKDFNKSKAADTLAGLMQVSSKRMAALLGAGLGLDSGQRRVLQANVAAQEIHNYVHLDGREVSRSVNRANASSAYRTARQTSGYRG